MISRDNYIYLGLKVAGASTNRMGALQLGRRQPSMCPTAPTGQSPGIKLVSTVDLSDAGFTCSD